VYVCMCVYVCVTASSQRNGNRETRVGGGMGGWVGVQKLITDLDMRKGHKGGVRVGFININDMYNNDVGKGAVYAYEAYEAK
jgi:hypothetical protein